MFPSARSVVVIQRTIKILMEEKPGRIQKERSPDWSHSFHTPRPSWFCTSESVQYMRVSSRRARLVSSMGITTINPGPRCQQCLVLPFLSLCFLPSVSIIDGLSVLR